VTLPDGRWSVIDLAWPGARYGLEYEGGHHREAGRYAADLRRVELLRDIDWRLTHTEWLQLTQRPEELVLRVQRRLADRGVHLRLRPRRYWIVPVR